uniref:Phorbol-ester/DAG-type domain-containing protein n=2 Tax=Noccaea caerulescens TaxID=107243 RepID=A0A1J3GJI4_NOCCA
MRRFKKTKAVKDKDVGGDERGRRRCMVSDPGQSHSLFRGAGYKIKHDCFACGENSVVDENRFVHDGEMFNVENLENLFTYKSYVEQLEASRFHYYCTKCDIEFHSECSQFPSKMIHPYHPQHPLTFTFLNYETGIMADTSYREFYKVLASFELELSEYLKTIEPKSNIIFDKCTWCRNDLGEWFYRCSICNFSLDLRCSTNIPPLAIKNPKSHHHSLALFPRPLSFPCDACGLINVSEPSYACYLCNYVVHQCCVDLPRVIKITRHPHRLSHTPCLPTKVSTCRVCYKNVDIRYGQYSCSHEDCCYVVHSKCATHENIWDGRELVWEPEESYQTEDMAPFVKVGGDLIEHFCHDHHVLRLEKSVGDSEKQCDACIRPIGSHDHFYSCIECDFFLHEACANLPRKLDHALHKHPLFLDSASLCEQYRQELICFACSRFSSGWKYKCKEIGCTSRCQLDINCILLPECFTHKSHEEHLLFISASCNADDKVLCQGCKESVHHVHGYQYHLHCTLCEFALCYKCATIPDEIYHKYDEHPLFLCYGKSGVEDDVVWWCEVCEKRLDPTEWFYTTNSSDQSCTTIHHGCLFGDSALFKAGHIFSDHVEVVGNDSCSRPICGMCHRRCRHSVYLKVDGNKRSHVRFLDEVTLLCSVRCLSNTRWRRSSRRTSLYQGRFDSVTRKEPDSLHLG